MRRAATAVALIAFLLSAAASSQALEETYESLSASVEVAPVFELSLTNPHLAFREVGPGDTEILGEGGFFNEAKCRSNSGRPWYLKVHLVSPLKHASQNYALAPSSLKLKVVEVFGSSSPVRGRFDFEGFSDEPMLLYASQAEDAFGKEVTLRFQYSLTCPLDPPALAGQYLGQILFTIAESP